MRYLSPAGPIRVDIGINPITQETLPVVTEDIVNGRTTLVTLNLPRTYNTGTSLFSQTDVALGYRGSLLMQALPEDPKSETDSVPTGVGW